MNGRNNYSTSLQRNYKPNINIFFFVANHFPQIAFKSGKSAKDLAVYKKDNGEQSLTER
jgi:hypothetical protein